MERGTLRPFVGELSAFLLVALMLAVPVLAEIPPGYYDSTDASDAAALRLSLHDVIDDHTRFPYTSSSTDVWNILNLADEDPNDSGRVVDVYKNTSYAKISGGTGAYNREHTWPKSFGFPSDNSGNYPYTDCHQLFISDSSYNSSRSNKPFRDCSAGCSEKTTNFTDGRGGGSGIYPGNSNWTEGSNSNGTWETWSGRKGDVARAIFYMAIRYEGGSHGVTGRTEPDLEVTDSQSLIDSSNTGSNISVAYMGMLSDLLAWHQADPVDDRERYRNDVVHSFQGNRNPFIDQPEWVSCVFQGICDGSADVTPPAQPTGLGATAGTGSVTLDWNDNTESDLAGYNIFRSPTAGGDYFMLNTGLLSTSTFVDSTVIGGTTYYYVVAAVDTSSNESALSTVVSATPTADCSAGPVFAGATSASPTSSCSLRLDWDAATPLCTTGVSYTVYRSATPGFTPLAGDAVASCVGDLFYEDSAVTAGQTYYYLVRAEEGSGGGSGLCNGGVEDSNLNQVSAELATSGSQSLLNETFDDGGWAAWQVSSGPGAHSCGEFALSTSSSQRPPGSTGSFALADSDACGSGSSTSTVLSSPVMDASGASGLTLEYDLYYRHYNGDDSKVEVWDGSQWVTVWSDSNASVQSHQTLDVSAYANQFFAVRFSYQNAAWDWWFAVDNVQVTASGSSCQ